MPDLNINVDAKNNYQTCFSINKFVQKAMKKNIITLLILLVFSNANAQDAKSDYTITNNEKVITNDMIFRNPKNFENIKVPLFLVNGNKVECISYFNKNEIKNIVVLQPKDAVAKYKIKGRNGVVIVTLKPDATNTKIIIPNNKIYYKCKTENNITDTSKSYFDKVNGVNCKILDLRDSAKVQTLYINFDNEITIKNLGVGWDKTIITISGGSMSGFGNDRIIRVTKKGTAIITIGKGQSDGSTKNTIFKMRVVELPKWR